MVKRILVGVDFSSYSKLVVDQAVLCAKHWKAQSIELVHVIPFVPRIWAAPNAAGLTRKYTEKIQAKLEAYFKVGAHVTCTVLVGVPHKEILQYSKKSKADIIILGHKSKSAVERFFLGTTAERVALNASVPVWVHRGDRVKAPKKVLLPYDFSKGANAAFQHTLKTVGVKKSQVTALYVAEPVVPLLDYPSWQYLEETHEKWIDDVKLKLKKKLKPSPTLVLEGDAADVICKKLAGFDLCVIATRGEGKILGTVGSVAAKVLRRATVPVLTVKL